MGQIPNIDKKLREAKFFLGKLSDKKEASNLESDAPDFYLSAFLTAGRSITSYCQEKRPKQYEGWETGLSDSDFRLVWNMTKQRNLEVHRKGANTQRQVEMVPSTSVHGFPSAVHAAYSGEWGAPGIPESETGISVLYFTIAGAPLKVIPTCKRYLELLEKLVLVSDKAVSTSK